MEQPTVSKKIPIHVALSTVGVGLILFTSFSIGLVSYFSTHRVVTALSNEIFSSAFQETTLTAVARLEGVDTILESNRDLVAQGYVKPDDLGALSRHFIRVLQANESLSETGYGDRHGRAIWAERDPSGKILLYSIEQQPEGGAKESVFEVEGDEQQLISEDSTSTYDPRERPWYQSAAASDAPVWTDPYVFANGFPGLSRSSRLLDSNGEMIGVFDVSFELDFLSRFLHENRRENFGELFIINLKRGGEVIAHPDTSVTVHGDSGNKTIQTVGNVGDVHLSAAYQIVEEYFSGDGNSKNLRQDIEVEGTPYVLLAEPFEVSSELGWYAVYLIPEEHIMGPVHRSRRIALLVGLFATIVGIVVAFSISKRMSHRLNVLSDEIEDVGQLILSNREPKESIIREIDVLETSVGVMKSGLLSFQKFVPTELVRSLLENGAEAKLEGRRKELTIFFSDIIGYSTICEQLDPEELVEHLGIYLEEMTNALEENQGTVTQYIGDAIMAIYGAPRPVEKHALQSCRGALAFYRRNEELAAKAEAEGHPVFRSRIGINTGEVIIGNLGSKNRLYYTANGDEVNLAARLESINSHYGTRIAISESTRNFVGNEMVCRLLDYVAVKGKATGTAIHELLGERDSVTAEEVEFVESYENGMRHYLKREWPEAIGCFESCLEMKEDIASVMLKERCEGYRENPPSQDWMGVFEMKQK